MLSIIGAGLGRTGTYSLHLALEVLGFRSVHFDCVRLNDVLADTTPNPDFRRYDDVDAVVDVPTAYFYRELYAAYPNSKLILTLRDLEAWWKSTQIHFNEVAPVPEHPRVLRRLAAKWGAARREDEHDIFRRNLRNRIYGSTVATEFICKKTFVEHNQLVIATIPPEKLLVMDICAGEGWEKLCPFLGVPAPDTAFPNSHTTNYNNPTPWKSAVRHQQAGM
jgi:hypothetical protein